MTRMLRRLITLLLVLSLLIFLIRQTRLFPHFQNWLAPKPVVVAQSSVVVQQIKTIAQLMTVEAYNEVVVDSIRYPFGISSNSYAVPVNPLRLFPVSQLVLVVRGKVVLGVDLKAWDTTSIRLQGDSLFVQLPRAQVLEVITNPSDVETFIEAGSWTAPAATALKLKARDKLVQQALAAGALPQADARARQVVYELLKNLNFGWISVSTAVQLNPPSRK